jgi:hypothetical protein
MFKDKDRRDTALLIIMGIITVLFIMYLLIPNKRKIDKQSQPNPEVPTKNDIHKVISKLFSKQDLLDLLEGRVERELKRLFKKITQSPRFFEAYNQQGLLAIYKAFIKKGETNPDFKDIARTLDRYLRLSFYDLKDIHTIPFPENFTSTLKFKTYLSLFLIRLKEEAMIARLSQTSLTGIKQLVDFTCYSFLGNEVLENYQSLPVLFYFYILMRDINVYTDNNQCRFFTEQLETIKDLTQDKSLIKIQEVLRFSVEPAFFRVHWEEYDSLNPNDKKTYDTLKIPLYSFLGQKYLIFPDKWKKENNAWINDLCDADSGQMELIDLKIQSTDPSKSLAIESINYSPLSARFVILLSGFRDLGNGGFLRDLIRNGLNKYHRNFTIIDYLRFGNMPDLMKKDLKKFGAHLYLNREKYILE